jgi:hypothetical protein
MIFDGNKENKRQGVGRQDGDNEGAGASAHPVVFSADFY